MTTMPSMSKTAVNTPALYDVPRRTKSAGHAPALEKFDYHRHLLRITNIEYLYTDMKRMNSGASADCFRGRNKETGKEVALKVYRSRGDESYPRECFLEEAYISAACNGSPHVNQVLLPAYETEMEGFVLVCELATGGDVLDHFYNPNVWSQKIVLNVIKQMILGLLHVHDCGFVHMDVKPENFVVHVSDTTKLIKLIDFGLAYQKGEYLNQKMSTVEGRIYYAPEKFPADPAKPGIYQVKPSFDIWGLGITMLSLMTWYDPWNMAIDTDQRYQKWKLYKAGQRPAPRPFCFLTKKWQELFQRIFEEDEAKRITGRELLTFIAENRGARFLHADHAELINDTSNSF